MKTRMTKDKHMTQDIYQEQLIDHYKHPRNFKQLEKADLVNRELNPSCGDEIETYLKLAGDKIIEVGFSGHGCAVSLGVTSMLSEILVGKSLDELEQISKTTLDELVGVVIGPTRINCELLGLKTFQKSIKQKL